MVLVSTGCFDEVILAEIFFSGSQFIKFDQIFYHILTDLIFVVFTFLFCGFVLSQDNH